MCQGPAPWILVLCSMQALAQCAVAAGELAVLCLSQAARQGVLEGPEDTCVLYSPFCGVTQRSNLCITTYNKPAWKVLSAVVDNAGPLGLLGISQQKNPVIGTISPNTSAADIEQHTGCALLHSPRGFRRNAFKETESTSAFLFVACFLGTRPAVEKLILYPFHLLPPASPSSVCGLLLSSFGLCCCLGGFFVCLVLPLAKNHTLCGTVRSHLSLFLPLLLGCL